MKQAELQDHTTIEWLNDTDLIAAPSQDRSRLGLQKILSAARTLFVESGYDETTITGISRLSGVSVGSIYHRFPDKLSILYAVLESYRRTRYTQITEMTQAENWRDRTLEDVLDFHIEVIFSSTRTDTGIMRLIERQRMVNPVVRDLQIAWNEEFCDVIVHLYRPHKHRIQHADVDRAVRYLHYIMRGSALWSVLSSPPGDAFLDIQSDEYRAQALRMAASYLGLPG